MTRFVTTTLLWAPGAIVGCIVLKGDIRQRHGEHASGIDTAPFVRSIAGNGAVLDGDRATSGIDTAPEARSIAGNGTVLDGDCAMVKDTAPFVRSIVGNGAVLDGQRVKLVEDTAPLARSIV